MVHAPVVATDHPLPEADKTSAEDATKIVNVRYGMEYSPCYAPLNTVKFTDKDIYVRVNRRVCVYNRR